MKYLLYMLQSIILEYLSASFCLELLVGLDKSLMIEYLNK